MGTMSYYFFFFNETSTTENYTLSQHDALPIFNGKLVSGETARALNLSFDQPRPKGPHDSRVTFASSHSMSFFLVHSAAALIRSEEHTSELQSQSILVSRLLLEK